MNSIKNKGNILAILVCHSPLCSWAGGGGGDVWCLCSSVLSRGGCIPLKSALRGAGSVARKWPRWGYRHSRNGQTSQEHSSWREAHCTPRPPSTGSTPSLQPHRASETGQSQGPSTRGTLGAPLTAASRSAQCRTHRASPRG